MSQSITRFKKIILIVLVIGFVASMLPLLYISKLNHPFRDDYSYSTLTHETFLQTNSVPKVLETAAEQVKTTYNNWQGTYSSVFLFALNPGLFGDSVYVLTAYIMYFALIAGTMFFAYALLVRTLNISFVNYLIISIVLIMISIQFIPSPFDGFYWYNGAVHYLFMYSLELVFFGVILLMLEKNRAKPIGLFVLAIVLAAVIGGGNFVTVLNALIILSLISAYMIYTKNKKWKYIAVLFAVLLGCMMVSVLAPGNANRMAYFSGYSPVKSIRLSLDCGLKYIFTMFAAPKGTIWCIILMLLAILPLMAKVITNEKFKFRLPWIVILLLYGVFSAMFTPQFYGLGDKGPIRIENIIFFSYVLYMFTVFTYIGGWLYNKLKNIITFDRDKWTAVKPKAILIYLCVIAVLFSSSLYTVVDNKHNQKPTSIEAVNSLLSREAYEYHFQSLDRLILLESDEENVVLEPLTALPELLICEDFVDNRYAAYYDKESVIVRQDEVDDEATE